MPELPEVETTRRGLSLALTTQKIIAVTVRNGNLRYPVNEDLNKCLTKQTILEVQRRGKYLILLLNKSYLLIHLGMSGHLRIVNTSQAPKLHDHIDITLNNETLLRFNDPRRFGLMIWHEGMPSNHPLLSKLGHEPLDKVFDGDYLWQQSRGRSLAVKNFIMDNKVVVGVGNIYAQESLFMARINPNRPAKQLSKKHCLTLVDAIKKILSMAIQQGGTTLKDFYASDGKPGYFSQSLMVYGRKGESCLLCQGALESCLIGQRSTLFCPTCQH